MSKVKGCAPEMFSGQYISMTRWRSQDRWYIIAELQMLSDMEEYAKDCRFHSNAIRQIMEVIGRPDAFWMSIPGAQTSFDRADVDRLVSSFHVGVCNWNERDRRFSHAEISP